ncbi:integrin beta-PS-like [Chelonus insularis]|uniref:integrin beta-PS-like n=1 Tax=Chelonus insularis TaxID=460826 RepID=UPI00158F1963|nr:integrin beta-PS-like [Chelonus insularis]
MLPKILFIVLINYCILVVISENNKNKQEQLCAAHQTCKDCIQTSNCIWCAKVMKPSTSSDVEPVRCIPRDKYNQYWCPASQVINETSAILVEKDLPLTSRKDAEPVQVKPQKIRIHLRKGEEIRIKLQYTQAEDYPVDLYYLMDLSASMQPYKNQLSKLGGNLAKAMKALTGNFRLGFGSFVDKVVLPMTDTQPDKLKVPCSYYNEYNKKVNCAPPYGYQHQMSLSEDSNAFMRNVDAAPISGNIDAPEGGFDALIQSIVCTEHIGWRQKARRLLVFSTDANFHLAGDGKLAGIVEPNDGLCHLDENGIYTYSLVQDYPSISQINRKAQEHNIHIIFAVDKSKNTTYQLLSQSIVDASVGLIQKNDTDNVIQIITGEYEKLVESVELIDNAPKYVSVQYFSHCLNDTKELKRSKCEGLRYGDVVDFNITLKLLECPSDRALWNQQFEIKPRGLNESLKIELELMCECPCDKPDYKTYEAKSTHCNNHGDLVCGICSCHEGYNGKYCDCHGNNNKMSDDSNSTITSNCRASVNDTVDCSGHGICKCGTCECEVRPNPTERFGGTYCECNNFSCQRHNRILCGGNGDCVCGTCDCYPGWIGESCGCHDNTTCFPPSTSGKQNTEICSGHGDCICGKCHCKPQNNILYSGVYCEDCPTCSGQHCEKLANCVECLWTSYSSRATNDGTQSEDDSCSSCHDEIDIERIDKVEINTTEHEAGMRLCRVPTDDGCVLVYKYQLVSNRGDISVFKIFVEEHKDCPSVIPIVGVAIGVVVSTVVLGLVGLIIWKIVTSIHDQREYAKFEKERAMAKWERGENPLYRKATTTFQNPTFDVNTRK